MAQTLASSTSLNREEIKQFASSAGPALTIFLPVSKPGRGKQGLPGRLRAAAQKAEEKLASRQVVSTLVRRLVDPIVSLSEQVEEEAHGSTLALFVSDGETRKYWLDETLDETVIAAGNFFIRPFLQNLEAQREFYLLALSQKDIRLLRCTGHSSEEVNLGNRIPHSLLEDMATEKPDHVMDNRQAVAVSAAGSQGVMFGTGTDREARDEYLVHFYKDVSRGIAEHLRGQEKTPLVVCGVDYELALFQRVNQWPNTCPEGVRGAPNGLKGGEMHARALDCLEHMYQRELDGVLAQHNKQGGEVASAGVDAIVQAAYDGRILHLLTAENAQAMGHFDEASNRAWTHHVPKPGDEDLINAAAVQTIRTGGRVHVLPQARVPGNRPMAAVMRY